jgi:hypothetical protein
MISGIGLLSVLPDELVETILTSLHPLDVAAFARTCRRARMFVYEPRGDYLWRTLFLAYPFDDPRRTVAHATLGGKESPPVDWETLLKRRVKAEHSYVGKSSEHALKLEVMETLVDVLDNSELWERLSVTYNTSANLVWLAKLYPTHIKALCETWPVVDYMTLQEHPQNFHKLLSAFGGGYCRRDRPTATPSLSRDIARCRVYDTSNYNESNLYGPFLPCNNENQWSKPNPDWILVDAIISVVVEAGSDATRVPEDAPWDSWDTSTPTGLTGFTPYGSWFGIVTLGTPGAICTSSSVDTDWAGVEGYWKRLVPFMDAEYVSITTMVAFYAFIDNFSGKFSVGF